MFTLTSLVVFALLTGIVYVLRRKRYRFPPGPKGLPIVGNIWDIPSAHEYLQYEQWSREYGTSQNMLLVEFVCPNEALEDSDIIYLNLSGSPLMVVNSITACNDLFDKRSSNYSDRHVSLTPSTLDGINLTPHAYRQETVMLNEYVMASKWAY